MPRDTTASRPGPKERLSSIFSSLGSRYDPAATLGIGEDSRMKVSQMDVYEKPRPQRYTQAQLRRDSEDVKRQLALLEKRAAEERARGEREKEKKTMDELADLMSRSIPTAEQGPFRPGSFGETYERIVNKPYPTGARRTRRSKKAGKKSRKGGKKSRRSRA